MAKVDAATIIDHEFISRTNYMRLNIKSSQSNSKEHKATLLPRKYLKTRGIIQQDIHNNLNSSNPLKFGIVCNVIKNPRRAKTRIGAKRQQLNIRYVVTRSRNTFTLSDKKNLSVSTKQFLCLSPKGKASTNLSIEPKTNSVICLAHKGFQGKNNSLVPLCMKKQYSQVLQPILRQKKSLQPNSTLKSSILISRRQPWRASLLRHFANNIISSKFKDKNAKSEEVFSVKKLKESFSIWGLNLPNKQTTSAIKTHFPSQCF